MTPLETEIRALTAPRNKTYPRPWTTDTDPEKADVLIVGASSATKLHIKDIGHHDLFIDGLWNRNGRTCRQMYDAAAAKPSRTRPNLERLSDMLAAHRLTSLQTNVSCASARYDAQILDEDRALGTEIFKAVVTHVPWKAMIIYGANAVKRFGRAFDVPMPPIPAPSDGLVRTKVLERDVFISPTLALPGYRKSVWPYLDRVLGVISNLAPLADSAAANNVTGLQGRQQSVPLLMPRPSGNTKTAELPEGFCESVANQLVWMRMQAIAAVTCLHFYPSKTQASLAGGSKFLGTDRVFRHKFTTPEPEILLRKDVFRFDVALVKVASWGEHKGNSEFLKIRSDELHFLERVLNILQEFSEFEAP